MITEPRCLVYLLLFYSSLQRKQWEVSVTRPLVVYSVLKSLYLHCGGKRVSSPRQHACSLPHVFMGGGAGEAPAPRETGHVPLQPVQRGSHSLALPLAAAVSCPYFCLPEWGLRGPLHVFNGAELLVLSDSRNPHHSTSHKCKKARNFHLWDPSVFGEILQIFGKFYL